MSTTQGLLDVYTLPQPEPSSMEMRIRITAIPLDGRVVRVARIGAELVIAPGFADDDSLRGLSSGVRIPVGSWSALAAAAAALIEDGGA
jgi:hypothetical protein